VPVGQGRHGLLSGSKTDLALAEAAAGLKGPRSASASSPTNNNPGNIVISGDRAGVDRAIEPRRRWARRAIPL
jgi:[acyl-carrier-protein] S-malonyltransferase